MTRPRLYAPHRPAPRGQRVADTWLCIVVIAALAFGYALRAKDHRADVTPHSQLSKVLR